ncbi:MAG: DUF3299 domain-containing protein [Bacteroidota bacterium]
MTKLWSIVRSDGFLVFMLVFAIGFAWFTFTKTRSAPRAVEASFAASGSVGSDMQAFADVQVDDEVWRLLMQAGFDEVPTPEGMQWNPQFTPEIEQLHGTEVRLTGYMIPLGYEEKQTHFLISAFPGHGCFFHMPGGPESIIEVKATRGVAFSYDTITVVGRLELLRDDPYGLLYRLVDAEYSLGDDQAAP